jgi:hypothetical protein
MSIDNHSDIPGLAFSSLEEDVELQVLRILTF